MCVWCAFWCRFVRACVRFVWVSFSSFVCRSSWSFFVCSEIFVFEFDFRVEFRIRIFRFVALFDFSNFDFRFECRVQVPWIFRVEFRIRLFRFVALFDFSNFDSNLSSKFSLPCSIRLLEFRFESFIALFDFSNFIALVDFSNFEFSIQVPWISNSSWSIRLLELSSKVSLIYSTSRISIRIRRRNCRFESFVDLAKFSKSHSSFEFLIELFNFRRNLIIINAIMHWRHQLFSHVRSRFALVATRALRALFVRKILVKRQFTCSLYFGIIEL